jgi:hypothetical protein
MKALLVTKASSGPVHWLEEYGMFVARMVGRTGVEVKVRVSGFVVNLTAQ